MTGLRSAAWIAGGCALGSSCCWIAFAVSDKSAWVAWIFAAVATLLLFVVLCACARILGLAQAEEERENRRARLSVVR